MEETPWYRYVTRVTGGAPATEVADRAGFDKSAMTRWKKGMGADAPFVVKFARAYGRPVAEALAAAGLITAEEAAITEIQVGADEALRIATDDELLAELRARLANVGGAADDDFSFTAAGPSHADLDLAAKKGTRKIDR